MGSPKVTPSSVMNPPGPDRCPNCLSKRIMKPRVVRDGQIWSYCFKCKHEWWLNKPTKSKGGHPRKLSWRPSDGDR